MNEAKANILLVDDKPDKLLALEVVLAELGENLVRAGSGREALRHLLHEEFAVILLDVNMPGMDGFETASLIRQWHNTRETPIIFITAYADEMHVSRGYSLGAVDYILAPVVPEVLRTKVKVFVDLFRQKRLVEEQAELQRKRAGQLQRLAAAALAINSARSLSALLQTVADGARELVEAHQAVALFLPAGAARSPRGESVGSFSDQYAAWRDRTLRLDSLASTELARSGRTVRMTQAEFAEHPDWQIVGQLDAPPIRGIMASPLTPARRALAPGAGRESMGLIYVSDKCKGDFSDDDEAILTQLAHMASIALENTLYAEERESNRLKDEFLATLSHELRTPLNAIFGWTQVLRADAVPDSEMGHALEIIERNVKVQSRLIEDLLDVSRITTGKLRLSVRPAPLGQIVQGAIETVRPAADLKSISLDFDLSPELGEINADPDRLQQAIWNLLSNAIKFTPEGGAVRVEVERGGGAIRIRVVDTGAGIHPAFLPHVFDPFRQADSSTTRRHGGLGLGLTIVRQIVEMHGGSVHAHSEGEGRGAAFSIELPERALKPGRASGLRSSNGEAAKPAPEDLPELDGLYVLAVDDDADARELIRHVLARSKANVCVVASGQEAIEQLDQRLPDVLITDIGMPDLDGYGLIRAVRNRGADRGGNVPAVALTAYVRDEDRAKMLDAGFTAHLPKPLDPPELVRVIARIATASRLCSGQGLTQTDPQASRRSDHGPRSGFHVGPSYGSAK